jgi:adenosine deaminase
MDVASENIKYLELIIGPAFEASFHNLSLEEVFEGVIKGIKNAESRYGIEVNLIVVPTFKWKERGTYSPLEVLETSLKYQRISVSL